MIRVWIETDSTVARAGFEALLESSPGIEVVHAPSQADVILRDDFPAPEAPEDGEHGVVPSVVVSEERMSARMLGIGVHAMLPRDSGPDQIVAAIHAAAAGLIAIPPEALSAALPAGLDHAAESLTPRETETLEMLAEGLSNKQIAGRLGISDHTAKFHVNSIMSKLGAGTRTEAVMRGLRLGLLKI